MLLELTQSRLAVALVAADAAIVGLLDWLATAVADTDYDDMGDIWEQKRRPRKQAVESVLALPHAEREALRDAVVADLQFGTRLDDPGFSFRFPLLSPPTRDAGQSLLLSMYDDVFRDGGFVLADGRIADRTTWESEFRTANPELKVCPACLVANLDGRFNGRSAVDLDHYLPKAIYPPLAVHGLNLVALCKQCNQTAKGDRDPLRHQGNSIGLPDIWFPYRRAGRDVVTVKFDPSEGSLSTVQLYGEPGAEVRTRAFDALFFLSRRWSQHLESIHIKGLAHIRTRVPQPERTAVKGELRSLATISGLTVLTEPGAFVASKYYTWLGENPQAFSALMEDLADDAANVDRS